MLAAELFVERAEVSEAAFALVGFEVVASFDIDKTAKNAFLEKGTTRIMLPNEALKPSMKPLDIAEHVASILVFCSRMNLG